MNLISGVLYDSDSQSIVQLIGQESGCSEISAHLVPGAFNAPQSIAIDGISYFPLSWGFKQGKILYARRPSPARKIRIVGLENTWGETSKRAQFRVRPNSNAQMWEDVFQGSSNELTPARSIDQIVTLREQGVIIVDPDILVEWRWCALRPPTHTSTKNRCGSERVVLATAACGSQMQMVTTAILQLANLLNVTLCVDVMAALLPTTPLAERVRYQISTPDSMLFATEYVDGLTSTHALMADGDLLLINLLRSYQAAFGR